MLKKASNRVFAVVLPVNLRTSLILLSVKILRNIKYIILGPSCLKPKPTYGNTPPSPALAAENNQIH